MVKSVQSCRCLCSDRPEHWQKWEFWTRYHSLTTEHDTNTHTNTQKYAWIQRATQISSSYNWKLPTDKRLPPLSLPLSLSKIHHGNRVSFKIPYCCCYYDKTVVTCYQKRKKTQKSTKSNNIRMFLLITPCIMFKTIFMVGGQLTLTGFNTVHQKSHYGIKKIKQ